MIITNDNNTAFIEVVKEQTGAKTIAEIARSVQKDYMYVYSILRGIRVSRKLIFQIAELYNAYDLPFLYEKFLQERKARENKKEVDHE
jgi:hypothetical protein